MIPYAVGEQVSLHVGKASAPAITTENKSSVHLQATLFITANPDGSMPQAEFSSENEEVTVRITRPEGGEMKTETSVFKLDELVSPGAYVDPTETEPTETTEPEPTETSEPESLDTTEAETSAETVPETERTTESETVTESEGTAESENATEAPKSEGSSGCSSSIGVAALPATAIGAAILVAKKKKKKLN